MRKELNEANMFINNLVEDNGRLDKALSDVTKIKEYMDKEYPNLKQTEYGVKEYPNLKQTEYDDTFAILKYELNKSKKNLTILSAGSTFVDSFYLNGTEYTQYNKYAPSSHKYKYTADDVISELEKLSSNDETRLA